MKWKRPSGSEIETNDEPATIEHCKSLGWEEAKEAKKQTAKKQTAK